MKCIFFIVLLNFSHLAISQSGTGLPVWVISPVSDSGVLVIDWQAIPPEVNSLININPTYRSAAITAVNKCGDPVFHIIHSGQTNTANNLFIYDLEGNPLLDNSTGNGPGLNAKVFSEEYQVLNVPGSNHEWYIIYPQFKPNSGAPAGDGAYTEAYTLYSRVSYRCNTITVLERDVPLTVSGIAYNYANGKAVSWLPGNPGQLCLYTVRRNLSSDLLSVDRFLINPDGIVFNKNTGNISTDTWVLCILGSAIEVTSDGRRIAVNNRDQSTDGDEIFIFDAVAFNNDPANYRKISIDELILQPDNNILTYPAPVHEVASDNPSLYFLQNISSKIYEIEFSPDGEYLYFAGGGFVAGGYTNATYIGQIDIGPVDNPLAYPYDLRLQIQRPPGSFDPNEGSGGLESSYPDSYHQLIYLEWAYDDVLYFIKRNTPHLFSIPLPNQPMPQCLVPSEINLADAAHPNIDIHGKLWMFPDQIDGYDYITSINPWISLGNDLSVCSGPVALTPGVGFESYCWQDGSSSDIYYANAAGIYWVEVIDEFGCFARDTIEVSFRGLSVNLGNDISMCEGDSVILTPGTFFPQYLWSDGSTGPELKVKDPGAYWVEVTQSLDCVDRDTVNVMVFPKPVTNLGPDSTICEGEQIMLDAGTGFSAYLWQDGADGQYYNAIDSGWYWVQVYNTEGCESRDSLKLDIFPLPQVDLGQDTLIVYDETCLLDAGPGFNSYTWQDGTQNRYYEVSENGLYWVEVENDLCSDSDSIYVFLNDCEAALAIPNCFTPNNDGFNDRFNVISQNLEGFSMLIFNRWGQKIFETDDINEGWDGKFKGTICPVGTYYFLVRFTTLCSIGLENSGERRGSVTLLQ